MLKENKRKYIFVVFVLLIILLFLYPYVRSFFVSPYYISGDTSEYFGFTNQLLDGKPIRALRDYKEGVTGIIPVYSKFPGLFVLLANLSFITELPVVFSFQILFFIFLFCLLIIFFKTSTEIFEYNNDKKISYYISVILIIYLFCIFRYENRIFLSTKDISYFFTFFAIYLFLNRKIRNNIKLILISLFFYSQIIFHHQSFLFALPIYFFIFGYTFFEDKSLRKRLLLLGFSLSLALFIHFYIFLLRDFNNFLNIGKIIMSENIETHNTLLNLDQIKFIKERTIFIFLSFLCVLKNRRKFRKEKLIIPFLFFYSLVGILQPYFYPLRFQDFLHFSFLLTIPLFLYFYREGKFQIVLSALMLAPVLISVLPTYNRNTGINNEYINLALKYKEQNISGCVLSDPITQFNFGHIANYESCYDYMRPTRHARDYYLAKERYLIVFGETNLDEIYRKIKELGASYLIFDSVYTPKWTPMIKYLESKEYNKIDVWKELDKHPKITLLDKKIYQKQYENYKNYTLYIYKVE